MDEHVDLPRFIAGVSKRNPGQPEFVPAVTEVAADIFGFMADKVKYHEAQSLGRIAEPDEVSALALRSGDGTAALPAEPAAPDRRDARVDRRQRDRHASLPIISRPLLAGLDARYPQVVVDDPIESARDLRERQL